MVFVGINFDPSASFLTQQSIGFLKSPKTNSLHTTEVGKAVARIQKKNTQAEVK